MAKDLLDSLSYGFLTRTQNEEDLVVEEQTLEFSQQLLEDCLMSEGRLVDPGYHAFFFATLTHAAAGKSDELYTWLEQLPESGLANWKTLNRKNWLEISLHSHRAPDYTWPEREKLTTLLTDDAFLSRQLFPTYQDLKVIGRMNWMAWEDFGPWVEHLPADYPRRVEFVLAQIESLFARKSGEAASCGELALRLADQVCEQAQRENHSHYLTLGGAWKAWVLKTEREDEPTALTVLTTLDCTEFSPEERAFFENEFPSLKQR